jgi:hypothetical protein
VIADLTQKKSSSSGNCQRPESAFKKKEEKRKTRQNIGRTKHETAIVFIQVIISKAKLRKLTSIKPKTRSRMSVLRDSPKTFHLIFSIEKL